MLRGMSHAGIRAGVRAASTVAGRRRVAKFARVVTNEVRLDAANSIESNGEETVQRLARTVDRPVIFDVGARQGEWSESLLAQPGSVPVLHAFEPSSYSRAIAEQNLVGRATVHGLALSSEAGEGSLHIANQGAGTNSLVADDRRSVTAVETVRVSTVDEVAHDLGIDRLTLLKVDVEGHDLAVIRGARGMLSRQAVDLVQFEYNYRWIADRAFLQDAFDELQPLGYSLGKITPHGVEAYPQWHYELEKFVEGNYLAWLPSWEPRLRLIPWWGG